MLQITSQIWEKFIGDDVLRGRYGLTCSQHISAVHELIISICWGHKKKKITKTKCQSQSKEMNKRWKRLHRMLNACLRKYDGLPFSWHWKVKDTASQAPTADMLTKPSFILDSRPSERGNSMRLIRKLVQNKPKTPISPQTYMHLVLRIYTPSYPPKIQHDMRVL